MSEILATESSRSASLWDGTLGTGRSSWVSGTAERFERLELPPHLQPLALSLVPLDLPANGRPQAPLRSTNMLCHLRRRFERSNAVERLERFERASVPTVRH
jgi:hypothetical protein